MLPNLLYCTEKFYFSFDMLNIVFLSNSLSYVHEYIADMNKLMFMNTELLHYIWPPLLN